MERTDSHNSEIIALSAASGRYCFEPTENIKLQEILGVEKTEMT